MPSDLPPIMKLTERLMLDIERAVIGFPHKHKYATGQRLRDQIAEVSRLCNRAWRDHPRRLYWTEELKWQIDELKTTTQLAKGLKAFRRFTEFENLIVLTEELGRQAGGWFEQQKKDQHHKRQNATRREIAPQRAQTLSTRAASASAGANT